jgi:hypothetical protein
MDTVWSYIIYFKRSKVFPVPKHNFMMAYRALKVKLHAYLLLATERDVVSFTLQTKKEPP